MKNNQQAIDELFSMFHDFDIVSAKLDKDVLMLEIIIPWGQMWNDNEYKIKVELIECPHIECDYYVIKSDKLIRDGKNRRMRDTEKKKTKNPKDLKDLGLSVQSSTFNRPNVYILHCNSSRNIDFAAITLTANDYRLYDKNGQSLTIAQMKQWARNWWNSIQKMWDEQKKED